MYPRETSCNQALHHGCRDARFLAIGVTSNQPANNLFCKVCKDDGALLMCSHCERSFHLKCLGLLEIDVPAYYWVCSRCFPLQEKSLKKERAKDSSRQTKKKVQQVRKVLATLRQKPKPRAALKTARRPCVKPQPLQIPSVTDLVSVCDFVYSFGDLLQLTPYTLEELHAALSHSSLHYLLKETLMSFISILLSTLQTHSNIEETLSHECRFLMTAMSSKIDLAAALPISWNVLVLEILKAPAFKEATEDFTVENLLHSVDGGVLCYEWLSYQDRLGLLMTLLNCVVDSKEVRDELLRRIKLAPILKSDKSKCKALIAKLEQEASSQKCADTLSNLQTHFTEIVQKIEKAAVRTAPLGVDKADQEYYYFAFMAKKVYIRNPGKDDWFVYSNGGQFEDLIAMLNPKIPCEKALSQELRKLRFRSSEEQNETTSQQTTYTNYLSKFSTIVATAEYFRTALLQIEASFSEFLWKKNAIWTTTDKQEQWKLSISQAQNCHEFAHLLLEHARLARAPLSVVGKLDSHTPPSYRRCALKIWQQFEHTQSLWQVLVDAAERYEQLAVCITIYQHVVNHYTNKKFRKPFVRQLQHQESGDDGSNSDHEHQCYLCEDGGEVICCETCEHVAHPTCVGLADVPEGDWFCEKCQVTA